MTIINGYPSVTIPIIIHKVLHALGMEHEQSRTDRDDYVIMHWNNIQGGTGNRNMFKINTRDRNPYDLESVLQYRLNAFAIDYRYPTITVRDSKLSFLADTATGLMFYDTKDISVNYQCTQHCGSVTCQNGGFLNSGGYSNCTCFCPADLYGATCEQVATSYECGGIIELSAGEERTITSLGWPNAYTLGRRCVWLVKGPAANHLKLTIDSLSASYNSYQCYHWLEIRYNLAGQTGPKLCGYRAAESYVTTDDELKNQMILKFDSLTTDRAALNGFTLRVQSLESGCLNSHCVFGTCRVSDGVCVCQGDYTGTRCNQLGNVLRVAAGFESTEGLSFLQNEGNSYDWVMASGSTTTENTGPSGAQDGSSYMYLESSAPHIEGDYATLTSSAVTFTETTPRCLQFYYSMYGADMGSLSVYYQSGTGTRTLAWTRSGDQGNQWHFAQVDFPSVPDFRVSFDGVRGSGFLSDIGLDNVQLFSLSCSKYIVSH
uniref:Metalloendopeptidase n=1 Tax=Crassostrea virginica TaxID=6565 RepID=A0A8B8AJW7_CRAVI|nr:zinc metalloproteinase dpy-31-like [Crassostrea virginica]